MEKKCLILFGEYRGRREAIEWDSNNLPDDWDSILSTWESTNNYTHTELFLDTKHQTIIDPFDETLYQTEPDKPWLENWPLVAMCNRIVRALKSISIDYSTIVVKRLDLILPDVFTLESEGKMWVEDETCETQDRHINDYYFVGQKDELLYFFQSVHDDIIKNNPPKQVNGESNIHQCWYEMVEKYIPYKPNNLCDRMPEYKLYRGDDR